IGVLASLLILAVLVLIWIRTRSLHLPLHRLWQIVFGSQDVADEQIRRALEEERSLMQFRFMFGIQVKTIAACWRLLDWARQQNVELGAVAACGQYFDHVDCKVREKLPSCGKRLIVRIVGVGVLLAASGAGGLIQANSVLVTFKASNRHFLLTSTSARPLGWS